MTAGVVRLGRSCTYQRQSRNGSRVHSSEPRSVQPGDEHQARDAVYGQMSVV
jgi:hypothetical protein